MAKYQMVKSAGGVFIPASDIEVERLQRFKNGEQYEVELKFSRNPQFHRKVFAFFNFCFEYWTSENTQWENLDTPAQFDEFRKNLTILAGYFETVTTIRGEVKYRAKSLSFSEMDQEEFEQCYKALITASIKSVFNNTKDENILEQLYSFFW
ncbi:Protein of uncharacterised function (DUF1367) [Phocoenobacter uteri]|uniref:Protein of uncharacterized function (DUF1367) n=1 Tax=Phocoenobacter uteri TaxID=146806 RepID=A0A379C9I4_9PAST|nr:DUF1367 family protein [Phocoenobacter uteri]MDG6880964.1 hypothetical protein [Phocoenobacter uteri]SUB58980.1 Protein of uncharacterised function (DUF1367) [Phocoenobacter uteri]